MESAVPISPISPKCGLLPQADIPALLAEFRRRDAADLAAMRRGAVELPPLDLSTPEAIAEERRRCRESFTYWAARCVTIKDKECGRLIPFRLNRPQRRVLAEMERMRLEERPIRLIMLKARQWGGSTLVQMYMAWIQLTRCSHWNSLICAQVSRTAASIRGMYDLMLSRYPAQLFELADPDAPDAAVQPALVRWQGQDSVREIRGRSCCVTLGTSENVDAVRGADYAMAHLSEVAFWRDTPKASPLDFIRSVQGSIMRRPLTVVVLESTANGQGNFFHTEWLRAERGESDKTPVFVPWHEIDFYRDPIASDREAIELYASLDAYERGLWDMGLSLERIKWYRGKRSEYADAAAMMAEFPTTPAEAFRNTGAGVFAPEAVDELRRECSVEYEKGEVVSETGDATGPASLTALKFAPDPAGALQVWEHPREDGAYVAAVDVGGRSGGSDWSVIALMDARSRTIVAQWRGHVDHDLLAWYAARLARYYNNALLVFESNTLEADATVATTPGAEAPQNQGAYLLHELYDHYPNLYWRNGPDGAPSCPGFHTNRATKDMIITRLIAAVRDGTYTERDARACDELATYTRRPNGSFAASPGSHDDIIMTRAILLHALAEHPPRTPAASASLRRYLSRRRPRKYKMNNS